MAAFNANLGIDQSAKFQTEGDNITYSDVSDTPEKFKHGIIQLGMFQPKRIFGTPATKSFYAYATASSDITGYRRLQAAPLVDSNVNLTYVLNTGSGTPAAPEYTTLEEFVTEPTAMDMVFANGIATTFAVLAHKDAAGVSNRVYVEGKIYHRTAEADETLIGSFEDVLSVVSTKYTHSITFTQRWMVGERLVMKYRFRNEGIPV